MSPPQFPRPPGESRNYGWEIRIGGPNRGDILILTGKVFKKEEVVDSSIAVLDYLCKQLGLDDDFLRSILRSRIKAMV